MDKIKAMELLREYNKEESHITHALAVAGVMKYFASILGEDEDYWEIVGLLHDIDYEMYPEEHCIKSIEILSDNGFDENFIHSVTSHGYNLCCDVEPTHIMEKVLYAVDELTGLITASCIMRPSKSILDFEVKSLKKKWKDKKFAEAVNRSVIQAGADMLNMPLEEVVSNTILGMRSVAEEIGLKGNV
ncbi:MAG: HDIG domain-containing protein [Tissierellia bacterium]|nr:HDIG domain-containing protein [Tissierellia bacterium]